ncbi:MAG: histidinol-phosphatase [Clostridia bacterium]|nr:histidinol-phosphatase [Clostridia bacterium]
MLTKSSAHVHTTYCDGKSTAAQMAKAAYDLGFVSLGFSSHAYQPFDPDYCMKKDQISAYRQEILDLKAEYEGKMAIYLGMERDFYSPVSPADYDYFIGSCHYFQIPEGFGCVDGAPDNLRYYIDHYCSGSGMELARQYFDLLQRYILSIRPPIIGHFDLVKKNNGILHLFDENDPAYRRMALDCLAALRETDAILEVNTGALARGYQIAPYPAPFLLKAWHDMKGKIMLNSDCHDARFIACQYDDAEEMMRACGYTSAVRLGRHTLFEEYGL